MSYVLSNPPTTNRTCLLGVVVVLHVGLFALLMLTRTVLPQVNESPLIVDLIEAMPLPQAPRVEPSPRPIPPVLQHKVPAPPQKEQPPVLETTASAEPASSSAPVVVAEAKPAAPASSGSHAVGDAPLVQARFDADYLRNPPPPYPPMSRRLREEGKVILRVRVSPEGVAELIEVKVSSGSSRLDDSAQRTVRTWKFIPAKRGGTPVESWVQVPIIFRLED